MTQRRITLALTLIAMTLPAWGGGDAKLEAFRGKVIPLADFFAKQGGKLDADAAPYAMVLVGDDGKALSIVKDAGSRMFFQDKQLHNRPMRLTGKLVAGSSLLQVINIHSEIDGKLHEVYYWCDICAIRGYEAGICDCCGGLMERRETPAK